MNNSNISKQFIPFNAIDDKQCIVVDALYEKGLILSHWKGANTNSLIHADTSAEIALNAIEKSVQGIHELFYTTATHYDIDGFIGVWSVFNPELALKNKKLLVEIATIGDFREIDFDFSDWEKALKIVCWLDEMEKKNFYKPFDSISYNNKNEINACEEKFTYFLNHFEDVLLNIEDHATIWEKSYNSICSEIASINKNKQVTCFPEISLVHIKVAKKMHYYSSFSFTKGFDIVLTEYPGNGYELEYKYTTWVDITSRKTFPRINLEQLCNTLNSLEKSNYTWYCDKITDTGPILRLENSHLSKAERFAHPFEREIYASTIAPNELKKVVCDYFKKAYTNITPKKNWSWKEIKNINSNN